MNRSGIVFVLVLIFLRQVIIAQEVIPLDTAHWSISANASYVLEEYKGKNALYLKGGNITLKQQKFLNGTIEFYLYLKEVPGFPGVTFRAVDNDAEHFYIRPHLPGKPDANQAVPITKGITPWQLYFGPRYSFPYQYKYDDWTHVKLVVKEDKAQIFLDGSKEANLSWHLFHEARQGEVMFQLGGARAMHIADISISPQAEIVDFKPVERTPIEGIISEWSISDKFERASLSDPKTIAKVISERTWNEKIQVEEGTAANISRKQLRYNGEEGETVFARLKIHSEKDQIKLFHFGYSDEVIAILNGRPIYTGTNRWRSRDYRYLGTVGLFDGIYLDLKKGENILLMAVSEAFGGWLITGKFEDEKDISVTAE